MILLPLGMAPLLAGVQRLQREIAALVPHLPIVVLVNAIRSNRRSAVPAVPAQAASRGSPR